MTEGEPVERFARRCIAEHLARAESTGTRSTTSSLVTGLERYEIQSVTDRVQALAEKLASKFEYKPRVIFSKKEG